MKEPLLSSDQAVLISGVSFRRLHYWIGNGSIAPAVPPSGTGSRTGWTSQQVRHLEIIAKVGDYLAERAIFATTGHGISSQVVKEIWDALEAGLPWALYVAVTADGRLIVGDAA